jgi:hypothetical protein
VHCFTRDTRYESTASRQRSQIPHFAIEHNPLPLQATPTHLPASSGDEPLPQHRDGDPPRRPAAVVGPVVGLLSHGVEQLAGLVGLGERLALQRALQGLTRFGALALFQVRGAEVILHLRDTGE